MRHHAIALIERYAGKDVATEFVRHEPEDVNGQYGRASREEVVRAVIGVHGGTHPWAQANEEDEDESADTQD